MRSITSYMLQLAGYEIERVPCENRGGNRTLGYRLRAARAGAPADPEPIRAEYGEVHAVGHDDPTPSSP